MTAALSYYRFILEEEDIDAVTNPLVQEARESQDAGPLLIMTIREIFWNFSDSSYYFGEKLADSDLFDLLINDLKFILKDSLEQLQVLCSLMFCWTDFHFMYISSFQVDLQMAGLSCLYQ